MSFKLSEATWNDVAGRILARGPCVRHLCLKVKYDTCLKTLFYSSGGEVYCICTEEKVQMDGGNYTLTKQLETSSLMIYRCPEDYYPYPSMTRVCQANGFWRPQPKIFLPQRCRGEWCDADVSLPPTRLLHMKTRLLVFVCSCWMSWPHRAEVRHSGPPSGEVLRARRDHVRVLLRVRHARLVQTDVPPQREVERLHSHLQPRLWVLIRFHSQVLWGGGVINQSINKSIKPFISDSRSR